MNKQFLIDTLGWGTVLWLVGYILGIIFFMIMPLSLVGWAIMPIGIVLTLWVLFKKINDKSFQHYLLLAIAWILIAIILDYFLLVKVFKPTDGYYKLDVYLYYFLTFILPIAVGFLKRQQNIRS